MSDSVSVSSVSSPQLPMVMWGGETEDLASTERSVPAHLALSRLMPELASFGDLTLELSSHGRGAGAFVDTRVKLVSADGVTTRGRGKGVGIQSVASGVFECLEHAVIEGVREIAAGGTSYVQDCRFAFEDKDVRIRAAATLGSPGIAFHLLGSEGVESEVFLPAAAYDYLYEGVDSPALSLHRTSNGFAAGATVSDAVLHALCEMIERDALSSLLVDVAVGDVGGLNGVLQYASGSGGAVAAMVEEELGEAVRIWKLPSLGANVALAETGEVDAFGRVDFGVGCSLDEEYAIHRAVLELFQERTVSRGEYVDRDVVANSARVDQLSRYPNLLRAAVGDFPGVIDSDRARCEVESNRPGGLAGDPGDLVNHLCRSLLNEYGISVMYRELVTSVKSGVVVQVACPGMEAFHHVRSMIPCEPVGRLRSRLVLDACRETVV